MPVKPKKRIIRKTKPSRKIKKPVRKSAHVTMCEDFCNRLQADDNNIPKIAVELADILNLDYVMGQFFVEKLLSRFDSEIKTLQMNYPDNVSFMVKLSWQDRSKKPKHGHLYPTLYAIKTSRLMLRAAMLAYLHIAKHAGKFP